MGESCSGKHFGPCGNQGEDCVCMSEQLDTATLSRCNLFALLSNCSPLTLHHSAAAWRGCGAHATPCPSTPSSPPLPSSQAVNLIYEPPLIWLKRLLRDASSLRRHHHHPHRGSPPATARSPCPPLCRSSVSRQSKSEEGIAQQAIRRLDTLTNTPLSFSPDPPPPPPRSPAPHVCRTPPDTSPAIFHAHCINQV